MLNIDRRYIFILLAVALIIITDCVKDTAKEIKYEQVYVKTTEAIERHHNYIKTDGTTIEYKEIPYEDITEIWETQALEEREEQTNEE